MDARDSRDTSGDGVHRADVGVDGLLDAVPDGIAPDAPQIVAVSSNSVDGATRVTVPVPAIHGGNLVVVGVDLEPTGNAVTSITDDGSVANTYRSAGASCEGGSTGRGAEIWYAADTTAGATHVTVRYAGGDAARAWVIEVRGMATASPLDVARAAIVTAGATVAAPPVTTTTELEVAFSIVNLENGTLTNIRAGNPFIAAPPLASGGLAYAIATPPGDYGAAWDATTSGSACASTVAFEPAD